MPTCWIIAGPNGAGKTTFALQYLPQIAQCNRFINADLIAAGLSPLAPDHTTMSSGKTIGPSSSEMIYPKILSRFPMTEIYTNLKPTTGIENLTPSCALIAELIRRYWILGIECSLIEIQDLAWFLERVIEKQTLQSRVIASYLVSVVTDKTS
jgi:hypothetical protein